MGAMAGALILCNLSASNITIGKARDRHLLSASQSVRCQAAYAYSAAGAGASTTDMAWDGQAMVHELGELLAESERFGDAAELLYADVEGRKSAVWGKSVSVRVYLGGRSFFKQKNI